MPHVVPAQQREPQKLAAIRYAVRTDYPAITYRAQPILGVMTPARVQRFMRRIDDSAGAFGCWPCAGALGPFGYRLVQGSSNYIGFSFTAHRVAWALHNGREPAADILHSCDNPSCCNWRHLREGTVNRSTGMRWRATLVPAAARRHRPR